MNGLDQGITGCLGQQDDLHAMCMSSKIGEHSESIIFWCRNGDGVHVSEHMKIGIMSQVQGSTVRAMENSI